MLRREGSDGGGEGEMRGKGLGGMGEGGVLPAMCTCHVVARPSVYLLSKYCPSSTYLYCLSTFGLNVRSDNKIKRRSNYMFS